MLHIYIYINDISHLKVNNLTLILLTWRKWGAPNNASKYQMGFNSEFKGLKRNLCFHNTKRNKFARTEISLIITCEDSELMGHALCVWVNVS